MKRKNTNGDELNPPKKVKTTRPELRALLHLSEERPYKEFRSLCYDFRWNNRLDVVRARWPVEMQDDLRTLVIDVLEESLHPVLNDSAHDDHERYWTALNELIDSAVYYTLDRTKSKTPQPNAAKASASSKPASKAKPQTSASIEVPAPSTSEKTVQTARSKSVCSDVADLGKKTSETAFSVPKSTATKRRAVSAPAAPAPKRKRVASTAPETVPAASSAIPLEEQPAAPNKPSRVHVQIIGMLKHVVGLSDEDKAILDAKLWEIHLQGEKSENTRMEIRDKMKAGIDEYLATATPVRGGKAASKQEQGDASEQTKEKKKSTSNKVSAAAAVSTAIADDCDSDTTLSDVSSALGTLEKEELVPPKPKTYTPHQVSPIQESTLTLSRKSSADISFKIRLKVSKLATASTVVGSKAAQKQLDAKLAGKPLYTEEEKIRRAIFTMLVEENTMSGDQKLALGKELIGIAITSLAGREASAVIRGKILRRFLEVAQPRG